MANVKITELPEATTILGAERIPVEQGGETRQAAASAVTGFEPWGAETNVPTTATISGGGGSRLGRRRIKLTGNPTLTVDLTDGEHAEVEIRQDATGGRTVTWVGVDTWEDDEEPTLATDADAVDKVYFEKVGGETRGWHLTKLVAAGGGIPFLMPATAWAIPGTLLTNHRGSITLTLNRMHYSLSMFSPVDATVTAFGVMGISSGATGAEQYEVGICSLTPEAQPDEILWASGARTLPAAGETLAPGIVLPAGVPCAQFFQLDTTTALLISQARPLAGAFAVNLSSANTTRHRYVARTFGAIGAGPLPAHTTGLSGTDGSGNYFGLLQLAVA